MSTVREKKRYDLIVVGAGPAGMAAAIACSKNGARVLVLDEGKSPGGQIYRSVSTSPFAGDRSLLGDDYFKGEKLVTEFSRSNLEYISTCSVWMVEREADGSCFGIGVQYSAHSSGETAKSEVFQAKSVLIATGALERPFPIAGWTLPGVITAGAAQTILKSAALVPDGKVVLAGTGPLLYLLAAQFARSGVKIEALLDTTSFNGMRTALPFAFEFMRSRYFFKGLTILKEVYSKTRVVRGVDTLEAIGPTKITGVTYRKGSKAHTIKADSLVLHQGVVPQVNLTMAAGCDHHWNQLRLAFEPQTGDFAESSIPGIFIAGDNTGIVGADAAEASGAIAAVGILTYLGLPSNGIAVESQRSIWSAAMLGRGFIDRFYKPAPQFRMPGDDVIACRCEGVTAGTIREIARNGAQGPNQAKTFCRSGMGPCQGRLCGLTVSELMANELNQPVADTGHYNIRNPVKPITLGSLAALQKIKPEEEVKAQRLF
ncbi:NAD(P)/FAD-dependent oxidoreductase [Sulfitobacter sp. 20_GPM-1509m]|uniref:FAD/NAD(P)-dependent oxidoreductase n=1 Tax=Sulfitobacter sp. 20_GPM-1509m TaxID=1380367 RepID=UPI00048C8C3D|nr:NAD(P)/FAD-dependent oxidoreductase [Sulfitobacter sp. 20_GPM-1509m]